MSAAAELLALARKCERMTPEQALRDELGAQVNEALNIASYITDDGDPTQSIDAAAALVPAKWDYATGTRGQGKDGHALLRSRDARLSFDADAKSPALALVAGCLRAYARIRR